MITSTLTLVKKTFNQWSEDRCPRMGAAIAYYTAFSIAPLLIIVIAVVGFIADRDLARQEIITQVGEMVGPEEAKTVEKMIEKTSTPEGNILASIIGVVVLLLGASGVFVELQDSLNTIWRAPPRKESGILATIRQRFLSFAMILVIGFLMLVSLVISAGLAALSKLWTPDAVPGGVFLWEAINFLVSYVFITLLIAMIYRVLPDVKIKWRDTFLGAAITALLFVVGKFLIGWYLGQGSTASTFGAAGSVVVILIWVYYSAQIFLFGAVFTRLWSLRNAPAEVQDQKACVEPAQAESRQDGMRHNGVHEVNGHQPGRDDGMPQDRRTHHRV